MNEVFIKLYVKIVKKKRWLKKKISFYRVYCVIVYYSVMNI